MIIYRRLRRLRHVTRNIKKYFKILTGGDDNQERVGVEGKTILEWISTE